MNNQSFLYRNGLSIVLLSLMFIFLGGQFYTGWKEHNNELAEHQQPQIDAAKYATSGHFISATFENWESEFLQMAMYVLLTISLRQKGSSESKKLKGEPGSGEEEVDREPNPKPDAPWPVRKGGVFLTLYKNSLSITFALLFLLSFALHFAGSLKDYNEEQAIKNLPAESASTYIKGSHFWFESFQNWQSEFLAVASIVLLSVWLRQKGSPESKPVDAPYSETGK
ncbi:MAG: hypothetical protein EOP56_01075 [Sphingobacteriales bacterium]|nr:MAG: hypothetical protein EOP56_01075 [Sphingobacteriales bacterium]